MIPHGRASKYSNDKCRCAACKAAWAAYQRELRERRKSYPKLGYFVPHGTDGGYYNYSCRCDACRKAAADAAFLRRAHKSGV